MASVGAVLVLAVAVACFRHYNQQVASGKLGLGPEGGAETHFDYQVRSMYSASTSRKRTETNIKHELNIHRSCVGSIWRPNPLCAARTVWEEPA